MAGRYDIVITQGASFNLSLVYKDASRQPIDLTLYSARMQVRASRLSEDTILDLTSADGEILLGNTAGTIVVPLTAGETAVLDFDEAVYDLELFTESETKRILEGLVTLSREVTR